MENASGWQKPFRFPTVLNLLNVWIPAEKGTSELKVLNHDFNDDLVMLLVNCRRKCIIISALFSQIRNLAKVLFIRFCVNQA